MNNCPWKTGVPSSGIQLFMPLLFFMLLSCTSSVNDHLVETVQTCEKSSPALFDWCVEREAAYFNDTTICNILSKRDNAAVQECIQKVKNKIDLQSNAPDILTIREENKSERIFKLQTVVEESSTNCATFSYLWLSSSPNYDISTMDVRKCGFLNLPEYCEFSQGSSSYYLTCYAEKNVSTSQGKLVFMDAGGDNPAAWNRRIQALAQYLSASGFNDTDIQSLTNSINPVTIDRCCKKMGSCTC